MYVHIWIKICSDIVLLYRINIYLSKFYLYLPQHYICSNWNHRSIEKLLMSDVFVFCNAITLILIVHSLSIHNVNEISRSIADITEKFIYFWNYWLPSPRFRLKWPSEHGRSAANFVLNALKLPMFLNWGRDISPPLLDNSIGTPTPSLDGRPAGKVINFFLPWIHSVEMFV